MNWYYKLHELPCIKLGGILVSLLRWADLPCFYPVFAEVDCPLQAEKVMEQIIADLVVYNSPLRGPFKKKEEAVRAAKKEFNQLMDDAKKVVLV